MISWSWAYDIIGIWHHSLLRQFRTYDIRVIANIMIIQWHHDTPWQAQAESGLWSYHIMIWYHIAQPSSSRCSVTDSRSRWLMLAARPARHWPSDGTGKSRLSASARRRGRRHGPRSHRLAAAGTESRRLGLRDAVRRTESVTRTPAPEDSESRSAGPTVRLGRCSLSQPPAAGLAAPGPRRGGPGGGASHSAATVRPRCQCIMMPPGRGQWWGVGPGPPAAAPGQALRVGSQPGASGLSASEWRQYWVTDSEPVALRPGWAAPPACPRPRAGRPGR
jgi:hypothetical protein